MTSKHRLSGVITLVQEQRFQLVDEAGVAHLCVLSHDIALTPADLRELQRAGRCVHVEYDDCSHLIAKLATRVAVAETHHETPTA